MNRSKVPGLHRSTLGAVLAMVAVAVLAAGCLNPFRPAVRIGKAFSVPAPVPNTAPNALLLLRWCWINRDYQQYEDLFTDDFVFAFSDKEALQYAPVLRTDELDIAKHLFVEGTASEPRVNRIDLDFNATLTPTPDQRPGKPYPQHVQISTNVNMKADLGDQIWNIEGDVIFYLVHADAADIPVDVHNRGHDKSENRWYIERWEDRTNDASAPSLVGHALDVLSARGMLPRAITLSPATGTLGRGASPLAQSPAARTQDLAPEVRASWGALKQQYRQ